MFNHIRPIPLGVFGIQNLSSARRLLLLLLMSCLNLLLFFDSPEYILLIFTIFLALLKFAYLNSHI
ncbi:uncharacterized protein ASCRUDRAFT_117060 [Ascoidea rubescens DSM 1968]|uniref:Uncharacterized protein n=1 Tax=Ascoidea rubescens DSM 1968 TaxID=1344418 RepID=A0A1D2VB62_9ASCO|nr:hypothetical protein ASCRUDRAFT_117060 [Ascoidea rubescens DSM 1968]ODV58840.1 hypothetical protein ASCRUDRAFT_117060 [Ascoidea rubescens DSM 1968]